MSEVMTIVRREFLERVRSRSFVIGTVLFPLIMAAVWAIPAMMGGSAGSRRIVIVDQGPGGVGALVEQALAHPAAGSKADDDDQIVYQVERVSRPLAEVRADLIRRVQSKELDGWLYLPPSVVDSSSAEVRARN